MNYRIRFVLALLIEWPLCLLVSGVFSLLSLLVVPLAYLLTEQPGKPVLRLTSLPFPDRRRVRMWNWVWMFPWGNDEDGIDGLPLMDGLLFKNQWWAERTKGWSDFRRIFTWCVLRNSASNLRFMPVTGYKINPSQLELGWHTYYPDHEDPGSYKGRTWFMWEGWRSNFYFEWSGVHFWIGWPQRPEDLPEFWEGDTRTWNDDPLPQTLPADDTRAPGVSFKLQIRR